MNMNFFNENAGGKASKEDTINKIKGNLTKYKKIILVDEEGNKEEIQGLVFDKTNAEIKSVGMNAKEVLGMILSITEVTSEAVEKIAMLETLRRFSKH